MSHNPFMFREPADSIMKNLLVHADFDFARPSPPLAWKAFQAYMLADIPDYQAVAAFFQCEADEHRDIVWMSFGRCLESSHVSFYSGCAFSRTPFPTQLKRNDDVNNWWWPSVSAYDEWKTEMEAMGRFQVCMSLDGWAWEGYSL